MTIKDTSGETMCGETKIVFANVLPEERYHWSHVQGMGLLAILESLSALLFLVFIVQYPR